jgi:hypothetical protein
MTIAATVAFIIFNKLPLMKIPVHMHTKTKKYIMKLPVYSHESNFHRVKKLFANILFSVCKVGDAAVPFGTRNFFLLNN